MHDERRRGRKADFVLTLHSHLPYVLHHGRWPHGSDWLCEAALDTYLPLVERLRALEHAGVDAPITVGVTPVLAAQLAHPDFVAELERYLAHRLEACHDAAATMRAHPDDESLLATVAFWHARFERLGALWRTIACDIPRELRRLQEAGRIELVASAATHAFLPLLGRDESVRLQLAVGVMEHVRHFGRAPAGCWLPECGYRPRGMWSPLDEAPGRGVRRGIDEHLADAGFRWFWVDAHTAHAGSPLDVYQDHPPRTMPPAEGAARARRGRATAALHAPNAPAGGETYSPYRAYRVQSGRSGELAVLVRDPRASVRVWSRGSGYPGDGAYLEFHKIRWPEGLRLWRVTDRTSDLGDKAAYHPAAARARARDHARDFAALLDDIAESRAPGGSGVIVTPFDTELFGHWWFEGVDFLGDLLEILASGGRVQATTAGRHLAQHPTRAGIRLARGSWGRNGDYSMWLNERVGWMWPLLWKLEDDFWRLAPPALARPALHPILAQAARELLLAQSSDWPFIVTTGDVADYGRRRFEEHVADARSLLGALAEGLAGGAIERGRSLAETLRARDGLFDDPIPAIAWALGDDAGPAYDAAAPTGAPDDERR